MSLIGGENAAGSVETRSTDRDYVDCVILIVTYNSAGHIGALLDSLQSATTGLSTRCLVVDNNSSDETVSILRSRKGVVIIEASTNLGYAGAINVGRSLAGACSSLLILNPDLIFEAGAIAELHNMLCQEGVGVTVPMLLSKGGDILMSMRREPTLARALGDAFFGRRYWQGRPGWLSTTILDSSAYLGWRDVEWADGAVMLISSACNNAVGDWDDARFFLYSEEVDFAKRARRLGYRVRYVPTARAYHEGGGSGRSPELRALLAVNRVRYYEKYHSRPATLTFRAVVILNHLLFSILWPSDRGERMAVRALTRRSRWRDLPGGRAASSRG